MNFVSLFAGVGGFDLAFERAGMDCVGQVEIDAKCREVLHKHWPHVPKWSDIKEVDGGWLGSVDVLAGGFPCQDYSLAGRRGGLAGNRGELWWQFSRLIDEVCPAWVIAENVPSLLTSNGGRDFGAIVGSLVELGYGVVWRVLDAQYFGVAQRRRRLFIVGHSGGIPRPEILDLAEGSAGDIAPSREAGKAVAALTRNGLGGGGPDDNLAQAGHLIARSLLTRTGGRNDPFTETLVTEPASVRRLTPLECERLQGFPDNWTAGQSDTQRYRQMGNAVAVPVVEWIGKQLVKAE